MRRPAPPDADRPTLSALSVAGREMRIRLTVFGGQHICDQIINTDD